MDRLMSMRVFQKVIDEGGFAAAARALDISPAVVTRLVADLEDHLGTRLLHRSTRRLSLSVAGETYLERVRAILQDIDEADRLASSQTHELGGVLRVLAPPVLASHVLAPLIAGFRQLYPKILLNIEVASFKEPPIEDYDITLMPTDEAFDADVIARKISTTEAVLVASPPYIQRKGTPATPQDLARHEVLRLKAPGLRPNTWRLFNSVRQDEPLDVAVEPGLWINHTDTLLRAALDGAGITSVAVDLVAPYLSRGELVRVLRPWITGRLTLYAALPSRKFLPERTRIFLEYLTEQTRIEVNHAVQACEAC
jgi:DNA-binding transcriptional LysR family regulator